MDMRVFVLEFTRHTMQRKEGIRADVAKAKGYEVGSCDLQVVTLEWPTTFHRAGGVETPSLTGGRAIFGS